MSSFMRSIPRDILKTRAEGIAGSAGTGKSFRGFFLKCPARRVRKKPTRFLFWPSGKSRTIFAAVLSLPPRFFFLFWEEFYFNRPGYGPPRSWPFSVCLFCRCLSRRPSGKRADLTFKKHFALVGDSFSKNIIRFFFLWRFCFTRPVTRSTRF